LVAAFASVMRDFRNDTAHSRLDDALRMHPEGTFYFVHGALLYSHDKYREAALQFHTAHRAPSIAKIRRRSLSMAIICESKVAIKDGKVVDAALLKECLQHVRDLEQLGPLSPFEEALALQVAQLDMNWKRAEQIVSGWEERGVGDQLEVMRVRMRLEEKKGAHVKAFQAAERVLAKEPKDAEAAKIRAASLAAIKKIAADNK
jgi:Tfp pilus assembly protein PilF